MIVQAVLRTLAFHVDVRRNHRRAMFVKLRGRSCRQASTACAHRMLTAQGHVRRCCRGDHGCRQVLATAQPEPHTCLSAFATCISAQNSESSLRASHLRGAPPSRTSEREDKAWSFRNNKRTLSGPAALNNIEHTSSLGWLHQRRICSWGGTQTFGQEPRMRILGRWSVVQDVHVTDLRSPCHSLFLHVPQLSKVSEMSAHGQVRWYPETIQTR